MQVIHVVDRTGTSLIRIMELLLSKLQFYINVLQHLLLTDGLIRTSIIISADATIFTLTLYLLIITCQHNGLSN